MKRAVKKEAYNEILHRHTTFFSVVFLLVILYQEKNLETRSPLMNKTVYPAACQDQ